MSELILHHYDFSNYAEKVRLALGYKGLAWRSVIIPSVAPKPDLTPLTGGYRRTPVLQIGADVFCDTRAILAELERRQPLPAIFPPKCTAAAEAIAYWAETQLFRPISLYVSGSNPDVFPLSLQADRAAMRGLPPPSAESMRNAAARNAPLVRLQIARAENMLRDGRLWICGSEVTIADFALYHALWFVTGRSNRLAHELSPYPLIASWMARMRAFGHGRNEPMTPTEALAIAAASTPTPPRESHGHAEDPPIGTRVRIRPDDYGRDVVEGVLVFIDLDEIALHRSSSETGDVVVHFPRLGYDLRPA